MSEELHGHHAGAGPAPLIMRHVILAAHGGQVLASILAGASVVATRAVVQDVPPLSLAVLRFGQGGLLLGVCLVLLAPGMLRVRPQDIRFLVFLGVLLYALFPLCFNAGLRLTEASRGAIILATIPVWTALLAGRIGQEHLSRRQGIGLVLTMIGVSIAVAGRGRLWQGETQMLLGDALILVAALCGAAYSVLAKRAYEHYSALSITAYGMLAGTVILLPAALLEGLVPTTGALTGRSLALVLFLGILGGALLWYLFAFALGKLSPTQVVVYINLNPLTAMILAVAFLDEPVTAPLAMGLAVVLCGVLLVNWPSRAEE